MGSVEEGLWRVMMRSISLWEGEALGVRRLIVLNCMR